MSEEIGPPPVNDRLASTLFLATLFHGMIIMGVTFGAQPLLTPPASPTLEVILVSEQPSQEPAPQDAEYLAQAAMTGGGNTQERVPPTSAPRSPLNMSNPGEDRGNHLMDADPGQVTEIDNVVATARVSPQDVASIDDSSVQTLEERLSAQLLIPQHDETEANTTKRDINQVRSKDLRELYISPTTKESRVANYLVAWKSKIEKVGTLNFPEVARMGKLNGSPVLEVAIRSDGLLEEIIVKQSSGHTVIDQAALSILRLAAPFDPFPAELRKDYDVLRFAYEWQFINGRMLNAAVRSGDT